MSDSKTTELLTKEDLALIEEQLAKTKEQVKTSLNQDERKSMEENIRNEIIEKMRKDKEEEDEKKRQLALVATEKATQEAALAKIKELEEKLSSFSTQSQTTASGSPYDPADKKNIDDYTNEELSAIDAASMKVFFNNRSGLNPLSK